MPPPDAVTDIAPPRHWCHAVGFYVPSLSLVIRHALSLLHAIIFSFADYHYAAMRHFYITLPSMHATTPWCHTLIGAERSCHYFGYCLRLRHFVTHDIIAIRRHFPLSYAAYACLLLMFYAASLRHLLIWCSFATPPPCRRLACLRHYADTPPLIGLRHRRHNIAIFALAYAIRYAIFHAQYLRRRSYHAITPFTRTLYMLHYHHQYRHFINTSLAPLMPRFIAWLIRIDADIISHFSLIVLLINNTSFIDGLLLGHHWFLLSMFPLIFIITPIYQYSLIVINNITIINNNWSSSRFPHYNNVYHHHQCQYYAIIFMPVIILITYAIELLHYVYHYTLRR